MESRPFYFTVVVWGEEFRRYFLDYCVASLLAPGNLPALEGRRPARFLIATTAADWQAMRATAIFGALERYAAPELLELPPSLPGRPNWLRSVDGHRLCCDAAFADRAYKILTVPDYIYADGMVARLDALAGAGVETVLLNPQPRIIDEPFFAALHATGLLDPEPASATARPLVCSSRQLVAAALRSVHSMTAVNEWDGPNFAGHAATPWWRVPGRDGMVICGPFWNPLLIDYRAVKSHDSSLLERRGLDGDYDMATIGGLSKIYAVTDSDEIYAASWSTEAYQARDSRGARLGALHKGAIFRQSYRGANYNSFHRALLFVPVLLHAGPLDAEWDAVETRALLTLLTWLDPPSELHRFGRDFAAADARYRAILAKLDAARLPWWRRNRLAWCVCRVALLPAVRGFHDPVGFVRWRMFVIRLLARRIGLAMRGDGAALRWWGWRLSKLASSRLGRPFHKPQPPIPD